MGANGRSDTGLNVACGYAADGANLSRLTLHESRRDIVPILDAFLFGVGWGHAIAAIVEAAAGQKRRGVHPGGFVISCLLTEPSLNRLEQIAINNRGLLAWKRLTLEDDLADVEAVPQQVSQRTAGERDAADRLS